MDIVYPATGGGAYTTSVSANNGRIGRLGQQYTLWVMGFEERRSRKGA